MDQLLVVLVPDTLRDELIDALISCEYISGFSLLEINGYSREHSRYSLQEQVAGYRKLHRFEVQHSSSKEETLLQLVSEACSASHARFWIQAISKAGVLGNEY